MVRLGPRPPSPFAPWQPLQEVANTFAPAGTASGWPASGLRSEGESGRGNWARTRRQETGVKSQKKSNVSVEMRRRDCKGSVSHLALYVIFCILGRIVRLGPI